MAHYALYLRFHQTDAVHKSKLGDSADNYGLDNDPPVDDAEDLSALSDEELDESTARSPSPAPTGEAFSTQLPISEQFAYTKQVLVALLNGQYLPARHLHIGFMKGGKSRDKVTSAAWKRGELSHRDKEELSTCIRRWMRRRGQRQALGVLAHDVSVDAKDVDQVCLYLVHHRRPVIADVYLLSTIASVPGVIGHRQ